MPWRSPYWWRAVALRGILPWLPGALIGGRRRIIPPRLALALVCLGCLEGASRWHWSTTAGVPFGRPDQLLSALYYPELAPVERARIRRDDARFDILLLGGSVLHDEFGGVGPALERELEARLRADVVIHNLAFPAHSTRDSANKYGWLAAKRFDLVVVYHGINEARANNCPAEMYRADYSHYGWYGEVNQLAAHRELRWLALPYTLGRAAEQIRQRYRGTSTLMPDERPGPEWTRYGGVLKSPDSFRHNLEEIIALAREREDPLLLLTFATFAERSGRYVGIDLSRRSTELWGEPQHVYAAIDAHNAVVRQLVAGAPEVRLLDQAERMPGCDELWEDMCHLLPVGADVFAVAVADEVQALLADGTAASSTDAALELAVDPCQTARSTAEAFVAEPVTLKPGSYEIAVQAAVVSADPEIPPRQSHLTLRIDGELVHRWPVAEPRLRWYRTAPLTLAGPSHALELRGPARSGDPSRPWSLALRRVRLVPTER